MKPLRIALVLAIFWCHQFAYSSLGQNKNISGVNKKDDLLVFAAASLSDALKKISQEFEKNSSIHVTFNFAASSLLARQIKEGADPDLFFSADEEKMNQLEKAGLLVPGSRISRLSNKVVLIGLTSTKISIQSVQDLRNQAIERIAIADPKIVPAGIYAKQYLTNQGLWKSLESKIIPVENVRSALAAVELGNVDAAWVYATDAMISKKVRVLFQPPDKEQPEISYPFALLKKEGDRQFARQFADFLNGPEATKIFQDFGFITK